MNVVNKDDDDNNEEYLLGGQYAITELLSSGTYGCNIITSSLSLSI